MKSRSLSLVMAAGLAASLASVASAQYYVATGLPQAIADSGAATPAINTITVPAAAVPSITSTTVVYKCTHTWNADMDIVLIRGGKYIILSTDNGSSGDNYQNVRFDDSAAASITTATTAGNINGTFKPEGTTGTYSTQGLGVTYEQTSITTLAGGNTNAVATLGFWNGTAADGDWTLWVGDDAGGDTGSIQYWSIEFNGVQDPAGPLPPPPPPPTFSGDFTGTPNTLTVDVASSGTTIWTGPTGAQPGLTDGSGEGSFIYATSTLTQVGNEVGYAINHTGGPIKVVLSGLTTDCDLFLLGAAGTPASSIIDSQSVASTETVETSLPAGTYYAVVDTYGAANNGSTYSIVYTNPTPPPVFTGNFAAQAQPLSLCSPVTGSTIWNSLVPQAGLSDGAGEAATLTSYAGSGGDQVGNEVAYVINHAGGDARFSLTGAATNLNIYLVGAGGTPADTLLVAEGTSTTTETLDAPGLAAGTYYVVIDTNGATNNGSNYTLNYTPIATVAAFSGDFTATPNTLADGVTYAGKTTFDPCASAQPGLTDGAGETPTYAGTTLTEVGNEVGFVINHAGGGIKLDLTGLSTDLDLFLLDSTGTPAGCIGRSTGVSSENVTLADAPAGTYYAVVDTYGASNAGSNFNLLYTRTSPPPAFGGSFASTPNSLTLCTPASGTTIWNSATPPAGLTDGAGESALSTSYAGSGGDQVGNEVAFSYVHAGGDVSFVLSGTTTNLNLYLLGAGGTPADAIAVAEGTSTTGETLNAAGLAAGTYYIVVDTNGIANNGSAFTLTASPFVAVFAGDFTATPNTLGTGVATSGTTQGPCIAAQPGLSDGSGEGAYLYTGTTLNEVGNEVGYRIDHAGGDIGVTLTGLSTDLDLFLLDSSGTPAGNIAQSTGVSNESITVTGAAAGTYYVVVDTYGTANAGSAFTVTATYNPASTCPCAADFDQSGGTPDAGDIDAFFNAWLLGDPTADADCSGGTPDTSDIDVFFQEWLAGGC